MTSVLTAALIWPILSVSSIVSTSNDALRTLFRVFHLTRAQKALTAGESWVSDVMRWTSVGSDSSAGVISTMYHRVETSGSIEKAVVYALSNAIFHTTLGATVIALTALVLAGVITCLVRTPLRISSLRFYVETRIYPGTTVSRLLFIFRNRRTWAMAVAIVYKYAWLALWSLTIVMAPVKYYSYLMYEYILAENPHADPRQALRLSQAMMKGNRRRAFLLDLSFLHWYALGLLTFGVAIYFYATPYRSLAMAELYVRLRQRAAGCPGIEQCNDPAFTMPPDVSAMTGAQAMDPTQHVSGEPTPQTYPEPWYAGPHVIFHGDYRRDYAAVNLVLLFFIFSFIGWVYETLLSPVYVGQLVDKGTLYGPWIPIYGCGGVAALLLLKRIRDHPLLTFGAAVVVCGVIEWVSATLIYELRGVSYWTYSGYFFNIQGRVCLEGLLIFGLGCSTVVYFLAPLLDTWLTRISLTRRWVIVAIIATAFVADTVLALIFPRMGLGLTS